MKTSKPNSTFSIANGKLHNLRILILMLLTYLFVIYHGSAGATGTPISIYAPGFDATTISNFQLNGSAARTGDNKMQLTSAYGNQSGGAFWKNRIYLGTDKSFSAYFTFLINGSGGGGADGLAFVIQTSTADAGSVGQGIGYAGITPSIAVEFDTYDNAENGGDNHVAIVEDGCPTCEHTNYVVPSFTLDGGTVGHVWIDYNGTTDLFEVRLSTTTTRPASAILSATKDLATKFANNNVFVGFTAATGASYSNHYIQDLLFENSYNSSGIDPLASYEQAASYTITYHVTAVEVDVVGASVAVNGITHTTDGSGNTTFSLADGIYPYTVSKTWYTSVTGTTTVSAAAKTENIALPPSITVSPSSLDLGYIASGGTSGEVSYTLSGIALSPSSGNITITPPSNFEVSFSSGSGFSASPINISYTLGTLVAITVYVRFKPTSTTNYSGSITISGGGATTQNVNLAGTAFNYCTPAISSNGNSTMYITNISTSGGLTNFTNTTSNSAFCYANYSAAKSVSQRAGSQVTLNFTSHVYGLNYAVWIDYNDDGTFALAEKAVSLANSNLTASTRFRIPSNAPLGSHRMRIRGDYSGSPIPDDPCSKLDYGETEDYTLNVEEPGPAISTSSELLDFGFTAPDVISSEMSYTLSGILLSPSSGNITITPPANFEVSFTSGSGFSASPINVSYTSGTLAATTVYVRFKPTSTTTYSGSITNSGGSATTQNVDLAGISFYCSATTNSTGLMGINNVSFNAINNITDNINYGYTDYTAISTNVTKGQTYTLDLMGYGSPPYFRAWFDWNNDGDFADLGEEFNIGGDGSNINFSTSITIPLGATTGNIRMRVRSDDYYYTSWYLIFPPACGNVEYGECEDYTVIVEAMPPAITASPSSLNFGYTPSGSTSNEMTYNLSASDLLPATGNVTITPPANFEVSFTSGSGFSAEAITAAYTSGTLTTRTIYVRFKPTSVNTPYSGNISNTGGTADLQSVAVTGTSLFSYCEASTSVNCCMGINHVVFNTINKTTNNTNLGYNDFTNYSTNVIKGQSYNLSIYGWVYSQYFYAWFDWNNDGDFADAGETFTNGTTGVDALNIPIAIPQNASTGNVRMRVRSEYSSIGTPSACGVANYGECEDYTVIVENAGPIVWDGSESTDWNTAGNWSTNVVPTASNDATIPDVTNDPIVNQAPGTPATCNNLTIEAGAVLTIANGKALTVSGTLTNTLNTGLIIGNGGSLINGSANVAAKVESAIPANQWHLISAPVSGATSLIFLHKYLQLHTESTNTYTDITPTTGDLTPMKGFALWGDAAGFTASYTGPLNAGAESYSTTYSGSGKGWNLAGNPYPSSIDWMAASGWTKTGVNNAVYIHVSSSSWATFIAGTGVNGGTRYIAPGQGFFIQATSNGTLSMTDAVRVHNATAFFKSSDEAVPNLVRLEVSGNGYKDEAVVRFVPEATAEFDGNYDAHKIYGDVAEAAQIYSTGSTPLAINSLPETNIVPVGIKVGVNGNYTLSATEIEDLQYVMLEDTKTGIFTDLANSPYTFSYEAGEKEVRFNLHFNTMLGITDKKDVVATVYSYQKTAYINMNNQLKGDIFIYNMAGQLVATKLSAKGMNEIKLNSIGNYVVKVVTDKTAQVKKIFIQ